LALISGTIDPAQKIKIRSRYILEGIWFVWPNTKYYSTLAKMSTNWQYELFAMCDWNGRSWIKPRVVWSLSDGFSAKKTENGGKEAPKFALWPCFAETRRFYANMCLFWWELDRLFPPAPWGDGHRPIANRVQGMIP